MNAVQTTHKLDFEIAPWRNYLTKEICEEFGIKDNDKYPEIEWWLFRVGTCTGQWRLTPEAYEILSIINSQPGNGHLNDLLEWFGYACKRSKLSLRIRAFTNLKFREHLIIKRGFIPIGEDVERSIQ